MSQRLEALDAVFRFGWGAQNFHETVSQRVQALGETAREGRGVADGWDLREMVRR